MTTITREIINPNFYHVTEDMDYATLCKRINKFKHLFLSKNLKKGDNLTINTLTTTTDMIASYFAAWELGLKTHIVPEGLLMGDTDFYVKAISNLLHALQNAEPLLTGWSFLAIHDFNKPIDPNNSGGLTRMDLKDGLFRKFLEGYPTRTSTIITFDDVAPMPGTDIQPWEVNEDDDIVQCLTPLKHIKTINDPWWPKLYSHKQILESVEKYIPNFTQDRVAISRNLHHNESIDYYFLPTLMTASKIYDINIMDYTEKDYEQQILNFMVDYVNKEIEKNKIERVLVPDDIMYNYMQSKKTKPFEQEVIFNIGKKIVKSN